MEVFFLAFIPLFAAIEVFGVLQEKGGTLAQESRYECVQKVLRGKKAFLTRVQ